MAQNKEQESYQNLSVIPITIPSKEVDKARQLLDIKIAGLSAEEQRKRDLLALQIAMEDYLNSTIEVEHLIPVGEFLGLYLNRLQIKQTTFAQYIGMQASNLNRILKGGKINAKLSFILGALFGVEPELWMQIQAKNEYLQFKHSERAPLDKNYKLDDLL